MPCELTVDSKGKTPLYRQILEQLRSGIYAGTLAPGEKLPSVRQMAAALGVNPLTVARALNELEAAGLVESQWGKGSFVLPVAASRREAARRAALAAAAQELASRARHLGFEIEDAVRALRAVLAQGSRTRS